MVETRAALRPFAYAGEEDVPAATQALFARMRRQTRAWVERVMGEAARGDDVPTADRVGARLREPLARAGLGPFPLVDVGGDGDDVAYGGLVRLDVVEGDGDADGSVWWVTVALRVNVAEDTAVYGFRLEGGDGAVPVFRFEPPTPSSEGLAYGDVIVRPLSSAPRVRVLLQSTHQRSWSRWQAMSWTLLESAPEAPDARDVWHHDEPIDITIGPSRYGGGPWVDPDGLTTAGQTLRFRGGRSHYCELTTRFQWAGERLTRRYQRSICSPF